MDRQSVTISQALAEAHRHIDLIDARILLEHVLGVTHVFLLTYPDYVLTALQQEKYLHFVQSRKEGMPVAYLVSKRDFFDSTFKVSQAVLVPRPETELLVELALDLTASDRPYRILDLGTGSGIIAITLAKHRSQAQIVAVDTSDDALAIARWNAENLGVSNLRFIAGNWFDELSGEEFDLIVSNPPYVAESDPHLQQGDLRFEPLIALSAGKNGLACIRHIIEAAPSHLVNSGWLLLEHGYNQADECRQLLQNKDFSNIRSCPDLAGIMRVTGGQINA
ncbi:MAG: peptide chain release factor N(5)-glutamine methyltransferase [Nitrosomonas sp. PRO4]|nr:peptide chain release factor N(5)-glutamine methyltransferase [Nitrosomonas sp. PRO4]